MTEDDAIDMIAAADAAKGPDKAGALKRFLGSFIIPDCIMKSLAMHFGRNLVE